jgi:hypothetical protein
MSFAPVRVPAIVAAATHCSRCLRVRCTTCCCLLACHLLFLLFLFLLALLLLLLLLLVVIIRQLLLLPSVALAPATLNSFSSACSCCSMRCMLLPA